MDGQKERQGDFVFTATQTGEYEFCFNNEMSTYSEKYVDFEITVWFPSNVFAGRGNGMGWWQALMKII